jgi:polycomb protein EED
MPTRKVGILRSSSSSSSSDDASSNSTVDDHTAAATQKYALGCAAREGHGHPIYCVAFSRHVHASSSDDDDNGDGTVAVFATCGGPYATIYEVADAGGSSSPSSSSSSSTMSARQVYRDADDGETFYTCAFGGRGEGSPLGYSPVGRIDDDDGGTNGGIVRFGDDDIDRRRRDSKRRRRIDDCDEGRTSTPPRTTTTTTTTTRFLLPYSDAQDGPPLLCIGGTRGIIKVIDTVRRRLFLTLSGHGNDVTDLKFSPTDEWLLLSSSKDESVRLWNLRGGINVAVFAGHNGHRGQVLSVSWHLGGTKFATSGMDNMVKLWKVLDGEEGGPVEAALRRSSEIVPDDWSEVGRKSNKFDTLFHQFPYFSTNKAHTDYVGESVSSVATFFVLDISNSFSSFTSPSMCSPFAPTDCVQFIGDLMLSKSVNNSVVLWKPLAEDERRMYNTHRVPSSILFLREFKLDHCGSWYVRFESPSPYHRILACGNQRGEVKVWHIGAPNDEDDGGCHPEQKHFCNLSTSTSGWFGAGSGGDCDQSTVRMVAFNPHGSHLVAVKDDSTVWMWDTAG